MHIASWNGGKDSYFACYLAIKEGMKVSHLEFIKYLKSKKLDVCGES
jgi:diphthamide synthase (EF-2-diphthine--ammonia ligase)